MSDDGRREAVVDELRRREPLFHRREFVHSAESFDACVADDFWEVGASGARYDLATVRRGILANLTAAQDACDAEAWQVTEFDVRPLGADTYLATYRLDQAGRLSRRSTLWRRDGERWVVVYHQGTLIERA